MGVVLVVFAFVPDGVRLREQALVESDQSGGSSMAASERVRQAANNTFHEYTKNGFSLLTAWLLWATIWEETVVAQGGEYTKVFANHFTAIGVNGHHQTGIIRIQSVGVLLVGKARSGWVKAENHSQFLFPLKSFPHKSGSVRPQTMAHEGKLRGLVAKKTH